VACCGWPGVDSGPRVHRWKYSLKGIRGYGWQCRAADRHTPLQGKVTISRQGGDPGRSPGRDTIVYRPHGSGGV
jgi:hypothetical protein